MSTALIEKLFAERKQMKRRACANGAPVRESTTARSLSRSRRRTPCYNKNYPDFSFVPFHQRLRYREDVLTVLRKMGLYDAARAIFGKKAA